MSIITAQFSENFCMKLLLFLKIFCVVKFIFHKKTTVFLCDFSLPRTFRRGLFPPRTFSARRGEDALFFRHTACLARRREYAFMYFFVQRERKSTKKNAAAGCCASAPVSLQSHIRATGRHVAERWVADKAVTRLIVRTYTPSPQFSTNTPIGAEMFADRGKTRHSFAAISLPRLAGEYRARRGERATALPPIVTLSVGFADTSPKGEA